MKKNYKENYKKIIIKKKMDLLEDLKIPLLNFNFAMTYIIHKMLVLIKNHLIVFLNAFLRSIIESIFF